MAWMILTIRNHIDFTRNYFDHEFIIGKALQRSKFASQNITNDLRSNPSRQQTHSVALTMKATTTENATIHAGSLFDRHQITFPRRIAHTSNADFVRHEGVVIATKIHGPHQWSLLEQSLCLLHHAYNHKVLYDIVVFVAVPVSDEDLESLQKLVTPAKVTVVIDNPGLEKMIANLSQEDRDSFLKRCNVSSPANVTWFSDCPDRIAYNWQAEFRGLRLWHHPSMTNYTTMLWMDADGFCTKPWPNDPVDFFVKNKGVIMFDHFPQAYSSRIIQPRIYQSFGASICQLRLSNVTGNLESKINTHGPCIRKHIPNIHGFFHITNLDFYRSPEVTGPLKKLFEGYFLHRFPDDQLAVTAPAAILAPDRSWEMRSKGFRLDVFHNMKLDGIDQTAPAGFLKYFPAHVKEALPTADGVCPIKAAN
jgi:hypothetical protein